MPSPNVVHTIRRLLDHQQILSTTTRSVPHPHPSFIPRDQINRLQRKLREPTGAPRTEVELVRPQEKVAARKQHSRYLTQELKNNRFRHLNQRGPASPPRFSFIPIRQLIEHASVLRVEEHRRNSIIGQGAHQIEPIHPVPDIELQLRPRMPVNKRQNVFTLLNCAPGHRTIQIHHLHHVLLRINQKHAARRGSIDSKIPSGLSMPPMCLASH